mgnify:CR=1 FL=1
MAADDGFSVAPPTSVPTSGLDLAKLASGRVVEVRVASLSEGIAVVASRHGMMQVDVAAFGRRAPAVGDTFRLEVRAVDGGGRAAVTVVEQTGGAAVAPAVGRGGEAAAQVLAQAVRDAAANQSGLAPLYATLAGLAAAPKGSVPEPVRAVVAQLMQARLGENGMPSAEAVRRAVVGSGVFLESRLAGNAVGRAAPGEDLKAALFALRAALGDWVGASAKSAGTPPRGSPAGAGVTGGLATAGTGSSAASTAVGPGAAMPRGAGDGAGRVESTARSFAGRVAGAYGGVVSGSSGGEGAGTGVASPGAGGAGSGSASPAPGAGTATRPPSAGATTGTAPLPSVAAGNSPPAPGVAAGRSDGPAAGRAMAAPVSAGGAPTGMPVATSSNALEPTIGMTAAAPRSAGTSPLPPSSPGPASGTGGGTTTGAIGVAPGAASGGATGIAMSTPGGTAATGPTRAGAAAQPGPSPTGTETPMAAAASLAEATVAPPAAGAAAPAGAADDGVEALLKVVVRGLELAGSLTTTRSTEAGAVVAALASLGPERDLRPAPPRRGQAPRGQAALTVERVGEDGAEDLGRRALERTEGALSRILLEQFAALDRRPDDAAPASEARATREWTVEMPLAQGGATGVVQMTIERDGGRGRGEAAATKGWRVRFSLDVEPLGPIHAQIGLSGERLSIGLWAERPDAAARLGADVGRLQGALEAAAIPVESIHLATGRPASGAAATGAGHLVDVKL